MTHVTELELNTRAFAPQFVHIPFIPVGRTKECQECAKIFLQVGSSAVRFKNVPLTTESKISLRSRSCSPAINTQVQMLKSFNSLLIQKFTVSAQGTSYQNFPPAHCTWVNFFGTMVLIVQGFFSYAYSLEGYFFSKITHPLWLAPYLLLFACVNRSWLQ